MNLVILEHRVLKVRQAHWGNKVILELRVTRVYRVIRVILEHREYKEKKETG